MKERSVFTSGISAARTKTISVTSGKGGVGKTTMVTNLAYQLGHKGRRILILDGDLGMANVDVMFGVRASKTIKDVIQGRCFLEEVLLQVGKNIWLVPGGSGVYGLHNLDYFQKQFLMEQVSKLNGQFDYMLVDTAPGIDDNVLYLNMAADEIVVVLTPDPSSLTDAYALIKVLNTRHKETRFSVLCNQVKDEQEALRVFQRLSDVAAKFLCVSLDLRGYVPNDAHLRNATKRQQLISSVNPSCASSFAFQDLAEKISDSQDLYEEKGGLQFFWKQLSGVA